MAFELVPHHHSQPVTRTISTTLGADNVLEKVAARSPKGSADLGVSLSPNASQDGEVRQEAVLKDMPSLEHVMDNRMSAPTDADAYDLHKEDIEQFQCALFVVF
eukprot:COSAG02_NODE_2431_length_8875_cov_9.810164_2_plen_104_part_00